jgi:transposase
MDQTYRRQILDHLGLVAAMFDELGIGEVVDQATQQNPARRDLTVGEAVKAMVLNGLGFVNHALSLVPKFFQHKPTSRLMAPRVTPAQLNDDALARALETLYAYGVTELYRLIAATAAPRLDLAATFAHLESTSLHVDGRYNSEAEPEAEVIHLTRGYRRDHRPDLNHVRLELMVEHQAGMPGLMQPLSGHTRDGKTFGHVVKAYVTQLQTTDGTTDLVAASALSKADNLQQLAETTVKWMTRVPATLGEAQAALAQAAPSTMPLLTEGYRDQVVPSTSGGVAQRWLLLASEHRYAHAQRTGDTQLHQQSDQEVKAFTQLGRTTVACEAEAQPALTTFEPSLQATFLPTVSVYPTPRDGKRGRPRPDAQPARVVETIEGALASALAPRQALIAPHRCVILATNELDEATVSPQEVLNGYQGQAHAERGVRFLKDPQFLAASLYLTKPARIMALLMVMTVCLLVYAALEYRIRKALKDHTTTFPTHKDQPVQNPTARWVFQYCGGIHVLRMPGQWDLLVVNLTEQHQQLLELLGKSYTRLYR